MKSVARDVTWALVRGVGAAALFRRRYRNKIVIVMYHAVVEGERDYRRWTHLPVQKFAWQVAHLKKRFSLLRLSELLQRMREGAPLPPNAAVITFDDGFRNNYTTAFPILSALQAPATIFLVTGHIDTNTPCWPDRLFLALRSTRARELDLASFGLGRHLLGSVAARDATSDYVAARLKLLDAAEKNRILDAIVAQLDPGSGSPLGFAVDFQPLTWREIELMHDSGLIEFGGHTVNHEILSRLEPAEQRREVLESCTAVRERLGLEQVTFAYPNGTAADFTVHSKKILRDAGILCGVSTVEGLCDPTDDLYELKRIGVGCDMTPHRFALLCSGFLPWLKGEIA